MEPVSRDGTEKTILKASQKLHFETQKVALTSHHNTDSLLKKNIWYKNCVLKNRAIKENKAIVAYTIFAVSGFYDFFLKQPS